VVAGTISALAVINHTAMRPAPFIAATRSTLRVRRAHTFYSTFSAAVQQEAAMTTHADEETFMYAAI
jgi:hypothetical protein